MYNVLNLPFSAIYFINNIHGVNILFFNCTWVNYNRDQPLLGPLEKNVTTSKYMYRIDHLFRVARPQAIIFEKKNITRTQK